MKCLSLCVLLLVATAVHAELRVDETDQKISVTTSQIQATINKKGYVTGVAAQSFVDLQTGFHDPGFGLDIVDWIMEPGSDETYRDKLPKEMIYQFGNAYHGKTPKRSVEGPQICTQAKQLSPKVIRGKDFIAIQSQWTYQTAAPGKKPGSTWQQTIVFPEGKRYFISSDRITSVNDIKAPFLRVDMPGHIKHNGQDTFSQVYLSYLGELPASAFAKPFAPDEKFNYQQPPGEAPPRMIRAYHLRDPKTGKAGPWLAGMTLDSDQVTEAWCHERGYVCMIEEFGPPSRKPIKAGDSFSAAFIVGYFDSIEEMNQVYDTHRRATGLEASEKGWKLTH